MATSSQQGDQFATPTQKTTDLAALPVNVLDSTAKMASGDAAAEGLRQRKGLPVGSGGMEGRSDLSVTAVENVEERKEAKVMGRTPDGKVFPVPHTPDMLTSIFHPAEPKTPLDYLTIVSLAFQIVAYFSLSRKAAQIFFFLYFAFWRASYDGGLGYVLKQQSEKGRIVKWVKKEGWMDEKRRPRIHAYIKQHLVTKMEKDYDFETMPIDYNIWLLFRSIVDVILLNDFVSYSLFAFSCTRLPEGHGWHLHLLRWIAGWGLIFFNLWVKMDAHRVVKDYAWYWGDCFFLCLQSLVFDGVYETAPDPMYSLGYAGYYGLSLVSGSYAVLFVSLAAHFAQFLFLHFFENPHIERTYGERKPLAARVPLRSAPYNKASASVAAGKSPLLGATKDHGTDGLEKIPSPRMSLADLRTPSQTDGSSAPSDDEAISETEGPALGVQAENGGASTPQQRANASFSSRTRHASTSSNAERKRITNLHDLHHRLFRKDTVIFLNIDLLRGNDFLLVVAVLYALIPLIMPARMGPKATMALLYFNALAWRAVHSLGLGAILSAQSKSKWMVRHYLKHYTYSHSSEAVHEAFANWKVIYNTSLVMTYLSFGILCWRCYAPLGRDWTVGTDLLRHVLGGLLVALHVWTANSSYKVLGPFGWLYGDFFIDEYPHQLYYTGIYRFVNNPERSMGGAAFFGLVLISGSKLGLSMAIISQAAHWVFLSTVEGPHMRKLYGEAATSRTGGVTRQLKSVAERNSQFFRAAQSHPAVKEVHSTFEKVQKDASSVFEGIFSKSKPRFDGMIEDTKSLLQQAGNRLLIVRRGDDIDTLDRSKYALSFASSSSTPTPRFHLGQPISIQWTAPASHSRRDWIGIYLISRFGSSPDAADSQALVTEISSQGKWVGLAHDEWDGDIHTGPTASSKGLSDTTRTADDRVQGVSIFTGSTLPWVAGRYEARYHHDAKHNVVARSVPFELYVDSPSDPLDLEQTYKSLHRVVTYALDQDPSLAPRSRTETMSAEDPDSHVDQDDFTIWDRSQAVRIASAVKQAFGVEFTTDVIVAEANVMRLAEDIVQARKLLDPNVRPAFSVEQ